MHAIKKTVYCMLAVSLLVPASLPVIAATQILTTSSVTPALPIQKSQPLPTPRTIYRGRVTPESPVAPRYRQVISESPGYHRYSTQRRSHTQPQVSARLYYQAPSTTVINRHIEVITPQNATSDVYFNQDTYYLYPSSSVPYHPARRYYPPVSRVSINPQDTENRAKQWTDKTDFNR